MKKLAEITGKHEALHDSVTSCSSEKKKQKMSKKLDKAANTQKKMDEHFFRINMEEHILRLRMENTLKVGLQVGETSTCMNK